MITRIAPKRTPLRLPAFALALAAAAVLGACGGDSDDSDDRGDGDASAGGTPAPGGGDGGGSVVDQIGTGEEDPVAPAGDIGRYGVVTVGDEGGEASDAVAGFFELTAGVSPEAFGGALDPEAAECRVVAAGGDVGFENLSAGFLPSPAGAEARSVEVGEALQLTSAGGTWAELQPMSIGTVVLYDVAPGATLPDGPVPGDLAVDVPDGPFPGFASAPLPAVEPLAGFDAGTDGGPIGPDASFAWMPGAVPGAKVRLSSGTNFFSGGDARTVTCTVPDTGAFAFDADTRAALGEDFAGDAPFASRVSIDTARQGDALLILVRESAATD